ncbi:polymerase alpha-associated DNA helicase A [Seminavis robusta]|uniref:Polymerase alpha-associated DNA helicase A n=1 Tax=Seminavis robusta TaxID=568900 RepID=A0A9N8H8T5_9STRA|nr:polymerase alpha-associated DNA helicase A [Seminavis robusta]|eukprot:Sro180_g078890.1 polymerase alpha-associated DNA helicase A (1992) ;mRNA; f:85829-92051
MTSVFLVGPVGCGRSELLADRKRFESIHVVDVLCHGNLLENIRRQEIEEKAREDQSFVSVGSLVDALVEASRRKIIKVPTCPPHLSTEDAQNLLVRLFRSNKEHSKKNLGKVQRACLGTLTRYRKALNVLVHPARAHVIGSNAEVDPILHQYTQVMHLLRIPFVEMKETEEEARDEMLQRAIFDHTIPSPLASLKYYETISMKKQGKSKAGRPSKDELLEAIYRNINLPFYMPMKQRDGADRWYALKVLEFSEAEVKQKFEEANGAGGLTNRFLQKRGRSHDLFLVQFDARIVSATVFEVLHGGLFIQGEMYSFLGCSSSGLKMRKAYLLRGTAEQAEKEREMYGSFAELSTVPKQIARFSLLLTQVVPTNVVPSNVVNEDDVEHRGANFTDGCGSISPDLANRLYQQSKTSLRRRSDSCFRETPSVFQIRYQGCKGVVVRDSKLPPETLVIRPSQRKFQTKEFPHICVADFSRPYSFGHLNRQFIMLLSGLGVPDHVFEKLQRDHFDRIRNMLHDRDSALLVYEWKNRSSLFTEDGQDVRSGRVDPPMPPYIDLKKTQSRLIEESPKLKILVPQSRTLFGVAETPKYNEKGLLTPGILQPGECLVRVTMKGGTPVSLQHQKVIVSKNPCYLLGDIRVLTAVSSHERPQLKELENDLVDTIVFPIVGDRPHSEEIAGSDLDGDQYFVCWDESLVPPLPVVDPHTYPAFAGKASKKQGGRSTEMVRYFASQNVASSLTGRVNNLYRTWGDLKGVTSSQCKRLGELFARVVDSAKSGEKIRIDPGLIISKESRPVATATSKYVWQRLEFAANEFVQERVQRGDLPVDTADSGQEEQTTDDSDEAVALDVDNLETFLMDLLSRDHLAMSEFTKFGLIMQHLRGDIKAFLCSQFAALIDFGRFSSEERGVAVRKHGVPTGVLQNQIRFFSRIVGFRTQFLKKHELDGEDTIWKFHWRPDSKRSHCHFSSMIAHALRKNTDALMILQLPDSVVLLLRFTRSALRTEDKALFLTQDGSSGCSDQKLRGSLDVKAVFISSHFGYVEEYVLKDPNYRIDLSDKGMQLYRGKQAATFVHVKILQGSPGTKESTEDGVPKLQISVDLTRFNQRVLVGSRPHPLVRKSPVFDMEMFVTNKRSDHSSRPARISHLDVLLADSEPWTKACFSPDQRVEGEDDEAILRHLQATAIDILKTIREFCSDMESSSSPEAILRFRTDILEPSHHLFGVANVIPSELWESITSLSIEVFSKYIPQIEDLTEKLATSLAFMALLSDLGVDTLWGFPDLLVMEGKDLSPYVSKLIEVLRRWDLWLAFGGQQKRKEVLQWLESAMVPVGGLDEARAKFAFQNAIEQAEILLEELNSGSEALRSSASVSRITYLRMETEQGPTKENNQEKGKKKLPIVSLHSTQAIPVGVRFATGEHVCISKQLVEVKKKGEDQHDQAANWAKDYEHEFPALEDAHAHTDNADCSSLTSKRGGFCVGRVVHVCDAPFSVKVKLVAASYASTACTPELINQCLESDSCLYWELSMIPANVITHMRNMDAIAAFLESSTEQKLFVAPEILPHLMPGFPSTQEETAPFPNKEPHHVEDLAKLNSRQVESVRQSLTSRVSLVHGPPGTGKSTTAIHIMREILATTDHRILVCAETNLAVDNLALKLMRVGPLPSGQAIRVGGQDKVHPDLEGIHLESLVKKKKVSKKSLYFTDETDFFLSRYKKIIADVLGGARIVFTTCAGAGDPSLVGHTFESVLMDEASMTTEPGGLVPLAHGCCHLVLIGDHKQLGPHALDGKCVSLFERLSRQGTSIPAAMTMLNQQHRMHPRLCDFPSKTFYNSELETAPGIENVRPIPQGSIFRGQPLQFVQVENGREQRLKSGSWYNEPEVNRVLEIVTELSKEGPNQIGLADITILTPYRAQLYKIQDRLKSVWRDPPEVCSVDGFQGRENEFSVVSSVRCGQSLGFCDDPQRVNVLLTRAKRGLIVLGDRNTLTRSKLWENWLKEASC